VQLSAVRVLALVVGVGLALFGVGVYQAWWAIAFAVGGLSVALLPSHVGPVRGLAFGAAIAAAGVLGGMSLFLLYGAMWGGTWWLLAAIGSLVSAAALVLVASRLRHGAVSSGGPDT
jgi:hypothetical protein